MKNTCTATFRIVTPMFLGGADHKATDIRPASIKGALRFWWRALNWPRILNETSGDEVLALRSLHAEEARLFGHAAHDGGGGQGIFLMDVAQQKIREDDSFKDMSGAQLYLLGMGLGSFKAGNHTLRAALTGEFTLQLLFRPTCAPQDKASVLDALYLFGLLGSLGSRARHGMGSVSLMDWSGDERKTPLTATDYIAAVDTLLPPPSASLPPFTAFSKLTRIDLSAKGKDPMALLTLVGNELQLYRSFGQNGKVQNKPAVKNFKADHDLIYEATTGKTIERAPQRAVFGLPHNYFFSSSKGKADVNYAPDKNTDGRRASPLLLHIHALNDRDFLAVHCLMPAQFLPQGAKIRIKAKSISHVDPQVDWKVLETYLNRFKDKQTIYG